MNCLFLILIPFSVYMVYEEEWTSLKRLFEIDKEICVTRNRGNHLIYSTHSKSESHYTTNSIQKELLSSEPKVCKECVEKKRYCNNCCITLLLGELRFYPMFYYLSQRNLF